MTRNSTGLCVALFAICGLAFVSVAFTANWWTVELTVPSSTLSDLTTSESAQAKFYQTKVKFYNDFASNNVSQTTDYSSISNFDRSAFNSIRGINIALIATSVFIALFGLGALSKPEKIASAGPLFAFLSFACFALCLTNLILLAYVPNDVASAVDSNSSSLGLTCGESTITWGSYTFTGSALVCGNIWTSVQFTYTGVSNSATIQYKTTGGAGWWWTFGAMLSFLICTFGTCAVASEAKREASKPDQPSDSGVGVEMDEPQMVA
jgi:hypothetical protein